MVDFCRLCKDQQVCFSEHIAPSLTLIRLRCSLSPFFFFLVVHCWIDILIMIKLQSPSQAFDTHTKKQKIGCKMAKIASRATLLMSIPSHKFKQVSKPGNKLNMAAHSLFSLWPASSHRAEQKQPQQRRAVKSYL